MNKHTAQTLANYNQCKFRFKNIKGKHIIGEMTSCDFLNNAVVLFDENEIIGCRSFTYDANRLYPILKTVDDLTDVDLRILGVMESVRNYSFNPGSYSDAWLAREQLLAIGAGAKANKKSPTGYVSIFDDLPCVRWGKV